jgi:putative zinc finger/helix-turn-helix YgiT family protein
MTKCHNDSAKLRPSTQVQKLEVAGRSFSVETPVLECPKCGEVVLDLDDVGRAELAVAQSLATEGPVDGETFRFMRKVLGLKAVDVASLFGVAPETVSRWETGARDVDKGSWALLGTMVVERINGQENTLQRLRSLSKGKRPPRRTKLSAA